MGKQIEDAEANEWVNGMEVDIIITMPLDSLIYQSEEALWDRANTAWSLKKGIMQIISEPSYRIVGHNKRDNTVDINVLGYIEISE